MTDTMVEIKEESSIKHVHISEIIRDVAEEHGFEYIPNYSGRFMYGSLCVGVVLPAQEIAGFDIEVFERTSEVEDARIDIQPSNFIALLKHQPQDNFGLDMIIYWPSIKDETGGKQEV